MIEIEQGAVAKLIDDVAVALLWKVATGRASEGEREAAPGFPPLLHLPRQVYFHEDEHGTVHSVVGTWRRDRLIEHFRAGPGRAIPAMRHRAPWMAAIGLDGAFPALLPGAIGALKGGPIETHPFSLADRAMCEPDDVYLPKLAAWCSREAAGLPLEARDRSSAVSAASFAATWAQACGAASLQKPGAFELEMRARQIGMAAGDWFAQRLSWSQGLIGLETVRAFNRLLAHWAAATILPRPFRLGLLDHCLASPGLTGVLLGAAAIAPALERAAAQHTAAPRRLPTEGVRYAHPDSGYTAGNLPLARITTALDGVPVFAPVPGNAARRCEMLVALRLARSMSGAVFRQPPWLALKRNRGDLDALVLRVGEPAAEDLLDPMQRVDVFYLSDRGGIEDLGNDPERRRLARVLRQLARALH